MTRYVVCLLLLACSFGVASADDAQPTPEVTQPPPAQPRKQPTTLIGRVTDILGKPIEGARIYVVSGARTQTGTDKDGRYSAALYSSGAHSIVIAVGKVHTYRQVLINAGTATTLDVEVEIDIANGGEVIKIVDQRLPTPAVPPKPMEIDQRKSLPYSDEAVERDAWAKAWILLDIDERGVVSRIKLLKRPGFGLDQIAIDESFKLRFEPARDAAGKPVRTYVLWHMEWPSWGWLVRGNGIASGRPNDHNEVTDKPRNPANPIPLVGGTGLSAEAKLLGTGGGGGAALGVRGKISVGQPYWQLFPGAARPQSLSSVPCAGSGPLNLDSQNRAYRDCSPPPDPKNAEALPWITRANAATALAELLRTEPKREPRPRGSRIPELTASVVTAVVLVGLVDAYFKDDDADHTRLQWFAAGAVVSSAVTAFLWGRHATSDSFSVHPTARGATVSIGRSF